MREGTGPPQLLNQGFLNSPHHNPVRPQVLPDAGEDGGGVHVVRARPAVVQDGRHRRDLPRRHPQNRRQESDQLLIKKLT